MKINKVEPKDFGSEIFLLKDISKKQIEEHLKLYQGYVKKYNEINEKIASLTDEDYAAANATYSNIRELKVTMTFAWGGIINHEIYFSHLGGKSRAPSGTLLKQIKTDFGSLDNFKKDLKATGIAARGWVWTCWNYQEKRLFNYLSDAHNFYALWRIKPIMVMDVYEHAYFLDFGSNRTNYIDAFLNNLNWDVVEKNFVKL